MSIFDGMEDDLGAELDDLGLPDLGTGLDEVAAGAGPGTVPLPDPFGVDPISPATQGVLDYTSGVMQEASATYAEVAAAEGLAPDLPTPGLEQAGAAMDAAMNADADQAARMAGFLQGETYVQEVKNDLAEKAAEVQQAEEASAAAAEADLLAWQAERAAAAAAREVAQSQQERGGP
ncbi:hypothetical protein ACFP3Q_17040 [Nocardioides sp. GCM10027113]|uniref:hypothetical protein n=1 Tax=unclassified Nocardioides TaxID=2615069 RepID=UPI00360D7741